MARMTVNHEALDAKAAALPVRWAGMGAHGEGRFTVASGSEPGKIYTVAVADPRDAHRPELFDCTCEWAANGGAGCSHARAVGLHLTAETVKRERAAKKAARLAPALQGAEA